MRTVEVGLDEWRKRVIACNVTNPTNFGLHSIGYVLSDCGTFRYALSEADKEKISPNLSVKSNDRLLQPNKQAIITA